MQKIKDKSGLALGAIVSLIASLFVGVVGVSPAAATNETSAVITPLGAGPLTENTILITEPFETLMRYGTGVAAGSGTYPLSNFSLHYSISSESETLNIMSAAAANFSGADNIGGTSISAGTTPATGYVTVDSTSPYVAFQFPAATSMSAAISVTVTPFLDNDGVAGWSDGDSKGDPYTMNFVPWSGLGGAVSITQPTVGAKQVTVSATFTEGTMRWSQLAGGFSVHILSTFDNPTNSGTISTAVPFDASSIYRAATTIDDTAVNFSFSAVANVGESGGLNNDGVDGVESVSARLVYYAVSPDNNAVDITSSRVIAVSTVSVGAQSAAGLTLSPATSANIIKTGDNAASARYNSAFSLTAFPYSASITTSIAVASSFTVSSVGSGLDFDVDSGVILNGVTYTSSAQFAAAGFTLAAGTTTVTVETYGQDATGTDNMVFNLRQGLQDVSLTVTLVEVAYTAVYTPTSVAGLSGASKTFVVDVEDQFGEKSVRTDMRILGSVALASSTSTATATVTAGTATLTIAPTPASRTGSATLTLQPQYFNQATQGWDNLGTADTVTWNVYAAADGADGFTSRTATASMSISYGVAAYSWSGVVSVAIVNSYSPITVTATGLVIENNDETTTTASDTLTVTANGVAGNFRFAGHIAGTYTVTFTNGTETTTSLVTIHAAGHDKGASISFDKSSIASGETSTLTGKLVDEHGNPVATGGTASVAVTYTGKGLPYGNSATMQTDADGEFTFQVLVLSTEKGDAAISTTYKPTGEASSTRNITAVHALSVGAAAASTADQKVNAGSFKGYVAVYAKGYEGQRLSAKVGNDWVVVASLASNFERVVEFTGAGYTIAVRIYIDRVLVDTITVTTK
jgi:hypothetical protein